MEEHGRAGIPHALHFVDDVLHIRAARIFDERGSAGCLHQRHRIRLRGQAQARADAEHGQ
jgi:hypothetical protein